MTAAFSSAMTAALDRYDTPQLPDGFADRLVARATAEAALEPATQRKRQSVSPWKRARRIVGSVAAMGFFSATAAAMGVFGEPVEIPVISDVARQLDLVEQPRPVARAIAATPPAGTTQKNADAVAAPSNDIIRETNEAARTTFERIVDDPRFKKLTPRQKRRALRRTARKLMRSGEATPAEVKSTISTMVKERRAARAQSPRRAALRKRIENATPEQKAKLRARFEALPPERQEKIKARLGVTPTSAENSEAVSEAEPAAEASPASENTVAPVPVTPPPAVKPAKAERAARLRDRYRDATPAQRAQARERARKRREAAKRRPSIRERRAKIRRRRN